MFSPATAWSAAGLCISLPPCCTIQVTHPAPMFSRSTLFVMFAATLGAGSVEAQDARVVTRVVKGGAPEWKAWSAHDASMQYPTEWEADAPGHGDTVVVFRHPQAAPAPTGSAVEVAVQRTTAHSASPASQRLQEQHRKVELLETGSDATGNRRWTEYAYDAAMGRMQALEVLCQAGGTTWILTYRAPVDQYDIFRYQAQAMIHSFSSVR